MKRSVQGISMVWLLFTVCIWGQGLLAQTANGYIQVKCEAGVKIFLDGTFKGIATSDVGGLIVQNVSEGVHEIKAVREGFMPQSKSFMIDAGQVFVYNVEPFTPAIEIKESGAQGLGHISRSTGTVIIQSLPVECRINIPGMGLSNSQKRRDRWIADKVPEGEYNASFISAVGRLNHKFTVRENDTTRFMVNFMDKKVIPLSYWDQPEGKVHIHSNNTGFGVSVDDLKYHKTESFSTPHTGPLKSSDYQLNWSDYKRNEVEFNVLPGKTTDIFIPFKQALLSPVTISDHPEYIAKEKYMIQNYTALPERSIKTRIHFKRLDWSIFLSAVFLVAGGCGGLKEHFDLLDLTGLGLLWVAVTESFEKKAAYHRNEENCELNKKHRQEAIERYNVLRNRWDVEIKARNEDITRKNSVIEKENAALGEAVVQVR